MASVQRDIGEQPADPHAIECDHGLVPRNLDEVADSRRYWPHDDGRGTEKRKEHEERPAGDRGEQEKSRRPAKPDIRLPSNKKSRNKGCGGYDEPGSYEPHKP